MNTRIRIEDAITELGAAKSALARKIGISRLYLYAYLEPSKYRHVRLDDTHFEKIARFERRSLASVRKTFASRSETIN